MPVCTKCNINKENQDFPIKKNGKEDSWCKDCHKLATCLFKKTKRGVIGGIYDTQKRNSKVRGHPLPSYTKEELNIWVTSDKKFHKIYDLWVKSGYKKREKPSIDRKDDFLPYTFGNIQIMTWGENRDKQSSDIRNAIGTAGCRCKTVYQYTKDNAFIVSHISTAAAARNTNLIQAHISAVCRGERKTHGGFIWKYNGH